MRWSKIRHLVEASFAESVRGRVTLHETRYASSKSTGRAWICLDGVQIANFSASEAIELDGGGHRYSNWRHGRFVPPDIPVRGPDRSVEWGEFTNYDFSWACWDYLHESVAASLESNNPIQQSLGILSARFGKRRLKSLDPGALHPLSAAILRFRLECEGLAVNPRELKGSVQSTIRDRDSTIPP